MFDSSTRGPRLWQVLCNGYTLACHSRGALKAALGVFRAELLSLLGLLRAPPAADGRVRVAAERTGSLS